MPLINIKTVTNVCYFSQVIRYAAFTHKTEFCHSCSSKPYCQNKIHSLVIDKDVSSVRGFPLALHPEMSLHLDDAHYLQLLCQDKR